MNPIKTILFPTDQSECSHLAFRAASALASDLKARLIILEVVPVAVTIYGPPSESYLERMRTALDSLQVDDPNVRVERRLAEGSPVAAILCAAKELDCDLIVMATHGRTGVKRLAKGSVAETVIRQSPCPVLVIKAPESTNDEREGSDAKVRPFSTKIKGNQPCRSDEFAVEMSIPPR
jgi:nucleotide-binding universal stress UspA family protein